MLSAPHRGVAESDLNMWIEHEATLRRLYIQENKPRKEVKSIMESVYGFPEMSLSIYEARLKNLLKLKKNMKQSEWQAIDAHLKARGDKATEVLLNGEVIPQRKVLKETRRNRDASIVSPHYGMVYLLLARPLPDNIEIRTPRSASPVSMDGPVLEARNGDDRIYNLNSGDIATPSTPRFPMSFVTSENFIPPALSSISPSSGQMTLAPETNPIISNLLLSGSAAALQHSTNFDATSELDPIGENFSSLATIPLAEWLDPTHNTCPTLNFTAGALWSTLSDSPFSKLVQNLISIRNDPSMPMSIFEFNTGLSVSNGLDSNILVTQPVQSISMDYRASCTFPSPWHENTSFGRLISSQAATQPRQPPGHVSRNFDMFSSLRALVSLAASPGDQFMKISDWLNLQIEWFSTSQLTMMLRCVLQSRGTLAPRAIWEIIIQVIGIIKDIKLFETVFDIGHKMGWVHEFRQICLMLALEIDSIDIAKQLLDEGASLFEKPQYHTSVRQLSLMERDALSIAARKCNPTALQLIIKAGANVNFRNRANYHPLYTVICAKEPESLRLECAKLLLDAGADASQHLPHRDYYIRQTIMDILRSELSLVEWARSRCYLFTELFIGHALSSRTVSGSLAREVVITFSVKHKTRSSFHRRVSLRRRCASGRTRIVPILQITTTLYGIKCSKLLDYRKRFDEHFK
ncbi:hypothetical protein OIDMADRAFT_146992 [Oidiodendron maius Zn]|uniref:Clr5 domain-containing protein n=1 Tax=Oidiodendron maius (strain Zn) TaxID=913774 RepID=A0A0C3GQX0_OIDMZ|nr:hypothetical protein OIDMADRAFT_146992 [Oidiodendron maius Zn]